MDTLPLTTNEIDEILLSFSKLNFMGVFPRDQLPTINKYPASFVLNTDPSYKVWEHWLGFYFDCHRKCFFFDSFGHDPEYFGLVNYVDKNSTVEQFCQQMEPIADPATNGGTGSATLLYYFVDVN